MDAHQAPASWKTKCTIRRVDDLGRFVEVAPGADVVSTLEMPFAPPRPKQYASIAPFVVDVGPFGRANSSAILAVPDDIFEAPGNTDVMGIRSTRPATRGPGGHFWAGLGAGALTLLAGAGLAFSALAEPTAPPARDRHVFVHRTSTLEHSSLGRAITPSMLPDAE